MRLPLRLPLILLVALAVTACTSASAGWTYTPAPPATPVPSAAPSASAGASGSPGASASAAPSGSAAPSASASGGTAGTTISIVAQGIAFTTTDVTAPANTAFQIDFDNEDANTQHNVEIKDGSGAEVFKGEIFPGIAHKTYDVNPLPAGAYTFHCIVHPNMIGNLTVQ